MSSAAHVAGRAEARQGDPWIIAGLVVVGLLVATAMAAIWKYKNAPGPQGDAPGVWPAQAQVPRAPALPTLVMFAHPMCPCTRASLAELRILMSEFRDRVTAQVLFALPTGAGDDWRTGDLWESASSIPGVRVAGDPNEVESRRFGAKTSGHVVLYGADGRLLFQGGITAARGHAGDNAGRRRVAALLRERSTEPVGSPTFGCPLDDPTQAGALR